MSQVPGLSDPRRHKCALCRGERKAEQSQVPKNGTCLYIGQDAAHQGRWRRKLLLAALLAAATVCLARHCAIHLSEALTMIFKALSLGFLGHTVIHGDCKAVMIGLAPPIYDDGGSVLLKGLDRSSLGQLGPYAPRYDYGDGKYTVPDGCEVQLVNSLERHGARTETRKGALRAVKTLEKIQESLKRSPDPVKLPAELAFLTDAELSIGDASILPYGALQAYYSGRATASLYPQFAHIAPFVRASGQEEDDDRVILAAKMWKHGFSGAEFPRGLLTTTDEVRNVVRRLPEPDVIISELPMMNNTLRICNCPARNDVPMSKLQGEVQEAFLNNNLVSTVGKDLQDRLRKAGAIDLNLTASDLVSLTRTCSFDTFGAARVRDGVLEDLRMSPFCGIFHLKDWPALGYSFDVAKYIGGGYGLPYYKAMGTGYIRELVARFTDKAPLMAEPTSINRTIDEDASQFPLPRPGHGPFIFFDGSHDNEMGPILASMGLFNGPPLGTGVGADKKPRKWYFGEIAPLQGKVVFEKLHCTGRHSSLDHAHRRHAHGGTYVRVIANGKVLDADDWCHDGDAEDGLCDMRQFLNQLRFAEHAFEWNKCYV